MDSKTLYSIAVRVTSKLTPFHIEIFDENQYSARIQVVSDSFSGMSLPDRFERLYELFYSVSAVPRTYAIQFEAWTESEFKQLQKTGGNATQTGGGDGGIDEDDQKKVAAPKDDHLSNLT